MISERTQFCQLAIQNTTNLWKKNAFAQLLENSQYFNFHRFPDLEANIKRVKQLEKQQEDTKQQKFLTSIEAVRDTDRKQHAKLVKRYQSIRRQNLMIQQKHQQQTLLEEYFEQTMTIYGLSLRAQLKNMSANKDPKTAIDSLLKSLRNYLQKLRKDYYKSNPDAKSKNQASLLGKIGGYALNWDDEHVLNGDGSSETTIATISSSDTTDPTTTTNPLEDGIDNKQEDKSTLKAQFASQDEMKEYSNPTERDIAFESLMSVFHETVDLTISDKVPKFVSFAQSLQDRIKLHEHLLDTENQRTACATIFKSVQETANAEETFTLNAEMVQTMEDERVKEQEQDKEQQVEIEKYVDCAYDRSSEAQTSWPFESLSTTAISTLPQFYHLNEFSVVPLSTHTLSVFENNDEEKMAFFASKENRLGAKFPASFFATSNYYNNAWVGARRLKNVCMYLDWSPSLKELIPMVDMAKIQTRVSIEEDLIDPTILRDIEVTIKTLVFLSACQDGLETTQVGGQGKERDYGDLKKLLGQEWDKIELSPRNIDDIFYLLTMRYNITESNTLPSATGSSVAVEFVADDKIDVSTLANTAITTQLNLDTAHLFTKKATINAKSFITSLAKSTSILYPGKTYQDNRYTVVVSLAEAETLRRIVHLKEEIAMQKVITQRQKLLKQQQSAQTTSSTTLTNLIQQPDAEAIISGSDAGFALRCMNFNGVALATTSNYQQPSFTQFSDSLLILRFLNNDVHYSDPQIHSLINLMDGNNTTSPFGVKNRQKDVIDGVSEGTLAQFFTSLLSARRRLQTKLMESSLKTILYTPHRYSLLKDSALALIVRKFLDLSASGLSSFDLFNWMDFNIDTTISPGEFYRALQYLIVNMWKYYVYGDRASGPDTATILSQDQASPFYITHIDIIHLFTSVLGVNAITSNSSTPVVATGAEGAEGANVQSSTQTFQLSQQAFGLSFKDLCSMLKTSEEPEVEDAAASTTTETKPTVAATPTELLSPQAPTPSTPAPTNAIPLADGLKTLDHDVFVELVAKNTLSQDQVTKSLYIVPATTTPTPTESESPEDTKPDPIDEAVNLDDLANLSDEEEKNESEEALLARLNVVASNPFYHDTKLKNYSFNFTTPELPPFVELIGNGKFVDAGTGNAYDNYWQLEPFSCFVVKIRDVVKKHNFTSGSSYISLECSVPAVKTTAQHAEFYQYKPTPIASNLGQLYQEFILARASLMKFIFCFETSRDHSYWINPAEIEAVIDNEVVDKYLGIDSEATKGETNASQQVSAWSFELRRAVKYYISCEKAIQDEIERTKALYPIAGNNVLKNSMLAQNVNSQQELVRYLLSVHEPTDQSILPEATRNALVLTDKGIHINNVCNPQGNRSPFSDEHFSVLTVFTPDCGNEDMNQNQNSRLLVNTETVAEHCYGLPQFNQVDLTLFGTSDFASARTPVKVRKLCVFLPDHKAQSQTMTQMRSGKPVTYPIKHFKTNFITAMSAVATQTSAQDGEGDNGDMDEQQRMMMMMQMGMNFDGEGDMDEEQQRMMMMMMMGGQGEGDDMPPGFGMPPGGGFGFGGKPGGMGGFGGPGGPGGDDYDDGEYSD